MTPQTLSENDVELPAGEALKALRVGGGGEGDVYRLPQAPGFALKRYRQPPSAERQDKVRAMCTMAVPALRAQSAWPVRTIEENGAMSGFVMPLISAHKDIHLLYGPKSRRSEFATADFRFLVRVAANTARAFASAHQDGVVIGDVNYGGVTVGRSGTVVLLDCDSFQIEAEGRTFHCTVAMPPFCPPELHGQPLHSTRRTPNHDNFGLAVLIFHLLIAGRHPFAGRYSGAGDMPVERAITEFRYAYGKYAADAQMQPPPGVAPIVDIVGAEIAEAFEAAFGRGGMTRRPDALSWIGLLDSVETRLEACGKDKWHFAPRGHACPWCAMEAAGGVKLFGPEALDPVSDGQVTFAEIHALHGLILATTLPEAPDLERVPVQVPKKSRPLRALIDILARAAVFFVAWRASAYLSWPWISFLLIWIIGLNGVRFVLTKPSTRRLRKRREKLLKAREEVELAVKETFSRTLASFDDRRRQLMDVLMTYNDLEVDRVKLVQLIRRRPQSYQLHLFLKDHRIENAAIPGIGAVRKAALISEGIETAANVEIELLDEVPGLGKTLREAVMQWRKDLERSFRPNPRLPAGPDAIAKVEHDYRSRGAAMAKRLRGARAELDALRREIETKRAVACEQLSDIDKEIDEIDLALA